MDTLRKIDIEMLEKDDVLLVTTYDQDKKELIEYKLVMSKLTDEEDCVELVASISAEKDDGDEAELGKFFISTIAIGKPLLGVSVPTKGDDGIMRISAKLKTAFVTRLEHYGSSS